MTEHSHTLSPIRDPEDWYHALLCEAFPEKERKPFPDILALMATGRYELVGLYEDSSLIGYATLWMDPAHPSYVLLDYLGVIPNRRNEGLGGELLARLTRRYAGQSQIIIEGELPVPDGDPRENDLRTRRLGLYRRCGFLPVYQMATCGMVFQALLGGTLPADLTPVMAAHRAIYGPSRSDVKIPLPPGELPETPYWMK